MLQMVRTLAQFTIALEDMRELGEVADPTALNAPASVGEEGPEKSTGAGCSNRNSPIRNGTVEVTAVASADGWVVGEGDRGRRKASGRRLAGKPWHC